jgi:hypothetical protein
MNLCELYNPTTETFSFTGSLQHDRYLHTMTLLANGQVLITGGRNNNGQSINSAEIYDPVTGTTHLVGPLKHDRDSHTATLLPDKTVLIAAGETGSLGRFNTLNSAELFNPAAGTFSYTGNLQHDRFNHTATLLQNGKVLIAAGFNNDSNPLNLAELYDPAKKTFSFTGNLQHPRVFHTATLLQGGKVLVAAGADDNQGDHTVNSAELYTPGP